MADSGIGPKRVDLEWRPEEPFAIWHALIASPERRFSGLTDHTFGDTILIELLADGSGGWTDADGARVRVVEGVIDVRLGLTPVTHALTTRLLVLAVGESAEISVAGLDVLGREIRFAARRLTRLGEDHYRIDDIESGGVMELWCGLPSGRVEILPRGTIPATS